jgi:hypothetical protein
MLVSNAKVPPASIARSIEDETSFLQAAGYFREQAAVCLGIARHISDPQAVDNLRAPPNILQVRTRWRDEQKLPFLARSELWSIAPPFAAFLRGRLRGYAGSSQRFHWSLVMTVLAEVGAVAGG